VTRDNQLRISGSPSAQNDFFYPRPQVGENADLLLRWIIRLDPVSCPARLAQYQN